MTIYKKIDARNVAVLELMTPMPTKSRIRLISRIQVPIEFRGKGFGSALMKTACELADQQDFTYYFHLYAAEKPYRVKIMKWLNKYQFILAAAPDLMCRLAKDTSHPLTIDEILEVRRYLEED
jgi:predicted GNAT family acetyltransferase